MKNRDRLNGKVLIAGRGRCRMLTHVVGALEHCAGRRVRAVHLDAAVAHLRSEGYPVRDEDLARISPLGWQHVNFLGRYAFTSTPPGELRPLRDPNEPDDDA